MGQVTVNGEQFGSWFCVPRDKAAVEFTGGEQRLLGWVAPLESVNVDALPIYRHFAAHKSMGPVGADLEGLSKQDDRAAVVESAQ